MEEIICVMDMECKDYRTDKCSRCSKNKYLGIDPDVLKKHEEKQKENKSFFKEKFTNPKNTKQAIRKP